MWVISQFIKIVRNIQKTNTCISFLIIVWSETLHTNFLSSFRYMTSIYYKQTKLITKLHVITKLFMRKNTFQDIFVYLRAGNYSRDLSYNSLYTYLTLHI